MTTLSSIIGEYVLIGEELIAISKPIKKNNETLTREEIKNGECAINSLVHKLDKVGKYSFQEMLDIISYIAIIEEFNYPKISTPAIYRGRSDCFGRYVEVLFGNEKELNELIKKKLFQAELNLFKIKDLKIFILTAL